MSPESPTSGFVQSSFAQKALKGRSAKYAEVIANAALLENVSF